MKVLIDSDELYPFYNIYDHYGEPRDVPDETAEHWRKVMTEFKDVQYEMAAYYTKEDDA